MYYTGTIKISFMVDAQNDDEVYEKIESTLPQWMDIDLINITDKETHEEHLNNYFNERKWEERYYEQNAKTSNI